MPGLHLLQKPGSDEPPHHRSTPVKSDEAGRNLFCQTPDVRLTKIVHQKTSDGNLCADIDKYANRAKDQIRMIPNGVVHLFADLLLSVRNFRQFETADRDG